MTASQEQIEMLLEYLGEHPDLAKGHIKSVDGRAKAKALWLDITEKLNSLGGAVKTTKQWQKVWADRKYLSKKAAAACRRAYTGTGVCPSTQPPPSDMEQKVVAIMGEGFRMPQTSAFIPAFPINAVVDMEVQDVHVDEVIDDKENQNPDEELQTLQSSTSRTYKNQPKRTKLRYRANDIKTQVLRLEEKKISELAGLRRDLRDSTDAVREATEAFKNK